MEALITFKALKERDPSRTTALRNAFSRALRRRFKVLSALILKAVVEEDVFGLLPKPYRTVTFFRTSGGRRFNYPRSANKVDAFMEWLRGQIQIHILDVARIEEVGSSVNNAWTNQFVLAAYRRGVERARAQMRVAGKTPPLVLSVFGVSDHTDLIGLLYTRVFNELKGITDEMARIISRILAQGIADGTDPRTLAKQLNSAISASGADLGMTDSLGRYIPAELRADMLARTEIIRAHAEAQLQEFQNWGVEGVTAKAEFITAGDARVCQQCQRYQHSVFTIEKAKGIIPIHPRCRCIWLPFIINQSKKE